MPNAFTHKNRHQHPDGFVDFIQDIVDFHERFGLQHDGGLRALTTTNHPPDDELVELLRFRHVCLQEEVREYGEALDMASPEQQLDALVDLMYFTLGTAYLQGFDVAEAWRRVHAANMAKVRAEVPGDSKRGSTFDVVKPPGWLPADLSDLVGAPQAELHDDRGHLRP